MNTKSGFLLSYIKYGDNDAIIHCYTKESGYESFFVKGLYSSRNNKKAYLSPLNELQLEFVSKRKTTMQTVSKISLIHQVSEPNIIESSILFFVSDFLNQILRNESNPEELYIIVSDFIKEINEKNYQAHIILLFILIKNLGFSPLVCEKAFLNPLSGCFSHQIAHDIFDANISSIWKEIIDSNNEYNIKIYSKLKRQTLNSLLYYFEIHSPNFRTPPSLDVLQQIFEE